MGRAKSMNRYNSTVHCPIALKFETGALRVLGAHVVLEAEPGGLKWPCRTNCPRVHLFWFCAFRFLVFFLKLAVYASCVLLSIFLVCCEFDRQNDTASGTFNSDHSLSHAPCGVGDPFPPCPFSSSSFALFYFSLFSVTLTIFFSCPSLSFPPE